MSKRREIKQLAKTIRQETGVPVAAAHIIARHFVDYDEYALDGHDKVGRFCVSKQAGVCSCCYHTVVEVSGPRGRWSRGY